MKSRKLVWCVRCAAVARGGVPWMQETCAVLKLRSSRRLTMRL